MWPAMDIHTGKLVYVHQIVDGLATCETYDPVGFVEAEDGTIYAVETSTWSRTPLADLVSMN